CITYKSQTLIIDNAFSSRTFITRFYLLSIEYAFLSVYTILPCICLEFSRVCYTFSIKRQLDIKIVLCSRKIMWTNTLFFNIVDLKPIVKNLLSTTYQPKGVGENTD